MGVNRRVQTLGDKSYAWRTHPAMASLQVFTNTRKVPIVIAVRGLAQAGQQLSLEVDGISMDSAYATGSYSISVQGVVPPGSSYFVGYGAVTGLAFLMLSPA